MTNFQSIQTLINQASLDPKEKEALTSALRQMSDEELASIVEMLANEPRLLYKLVDVVNLWNEYYVPEAYSRR